MPNKTPEGYIVLMVKLLDSRVSNFNNTHVLTLGFMVAALHYHQYGFENGMVLLIDLKDFSVGHFLKTDFSLLRCVFGLLQVLTYSCYKRMTQDCGTVLILFSERCADEDQRNPLGERYTIDQTNNSPIQTFLEDQIVPKGNLRQFLVYNHKICFRYKSTFLIRPLCMNFCRRSVCVKNMVVVYHPVGF